MRHPQDVLTVPAPIRVVQLVATLRDGGAEAVLRNLIPRLAAQADLDVHVVSVYDSRLDAQEIGALGAPVHEIRRAGRGDLRFAGRLLRTLRALRPQIVHGHIHTGKYAGRIAAIATGVPSLVFTEHGDEAGGVVRWAVKRVLNARTARFIVFTADERERYARAEAIPLERIDVIPNGIPAPAPTDVVATRIELGLQPGELALVSAARLVHQKNQELALRALARLRAQGRSHLRLFVIGAGADAAELSALAEALQLREAVTFLGYRSDAQRLTAAADIFVLPSRWEKMPLVLGEAMMAGVPVVSTPWTGVAAFVDDARTGYLAADWSVEAYAAALARAIDDPHERRAIAARGAQAASERFDMQRMVDAHASLYRTLTSNVSPDSRR